MSVSSTSSSQFTDEPYIAMEVEDDWKPFDGYDHSKYLTDEDHQNLLNSPDEVEAYVPRYMPDNWREVNGLDDNDIFHPVDDEWLVDLEIKVYELVQKTNSERAERERATKRECVKDTSDSEPKRKKKRLA